MAEFTVKTTCTICNGTGVISDGSPCSSCNQTGYISQSVVGSLEEIDDIQATLKTHSEYLEKILAILSAK